MTKNEEMKKDVKIIVCTHTQFKPVVTNKVYEVLDVRDNGDFCDVAVDGKTMRVPGPFYSEMLHMRRVLARKSLPEYIGFCHYRKYMEFMDDVPEVDVLIEKHGAITTQPIDLTMPMRKQYNTWGNVEDLDICTQIINERYPDFAKAWNRSLDSCWMHPSTMSIMRTVDFRKLFDVMWDVVGEYLRRIGGDIDARVMSMPEAYHLETFNLPYERRVGGQLGERIHSAWMDWRFPNAARYKMVEVSPKVDNPWKIPRKDVITVAIVHYNTPELTRAEILSIRKHGGEKYHIVILDNSDKEPWKEKMAGVDVYDNTSGQLIDFDAALALWPKRNAKRGGWDGCNFGSVKHMMSVDWLVQNIGPFILMDSDILLKQPIDDLWNENYTAVGQEDNAWGNPGAIPRLLPFLCFINSPECRRLGIRYHDPSRSFALGVGKDWYDTGASFLEDIKNKDGARLGRAAIDRRIEHLGNGSWRRKDKSGEWMQKHRALWDKNMAEPMSEQRSSVFGLTITKKENIMEHVDAITQDGRQYRLTAHDGYMLKAKDTGDVRKSVNTMKVNRWEVIEVGKPATTSKPRTAKRVKGKG